MRTSCSLSACSPCSGSDKIFVNASGGKPFPLRHSNSDPGRVQRSESQAPEIAIDRRDVASAAPTPPFSMFVTNAELSVCPTPSKSPTCRPSSTSRVASTRSAAREPRTSPAASDSNVDNVVDVRVLLPQSSSPHVSCFPTANTKYAHVARKSSAACEVSTGVNVARFPTSRVSTMCTTQRSGYTDR